MIVKHSILRQNTNALQERADIIKEVYLQADGAGAEHLKARIKEHKKNIARVKSRADGYKNLTRTMGMDPRLTETALWKNQQTAKYRLTEEKKRSKPPRLQYAAGFSNFQSNSFTETQPA